MNYDLKTEIKDHYIHAIVCGERTTENISRLAHEILDACQKNNIEEVLADLRQLTGRLTISESYLVITKELPTIQIFGQIKKVAVLELKERQERSRFFERVARAQGYNLKMFENQNEAIEWISKKRQSVKS